METFLTILYMDLDAHHNDDAFTDLSPRDGDVINQQCSLEEGISQIASLMHEEHPDDNQFNFFGFWKHPANFRVEADTDGWFKVPVFTAFLQACPVDPTELLRLRAQQESLAIRRSHRGNVLPFMGHDALG